MIELDRIVVVQKEDVVVVQPGAEAISVINFGPQGPPFISPEELAALHEAVDNALTYEEVEALIAITLASLVTPFDEGGASADYSGLPYITDGDVFTDYDGVAIIDEGGA